MDETKAVPAWEVLYASSDESFRRTVTTYPADGDYFKLLEVTRVELTGLDGWTVDASDPYVPKVRRKGDRTRPLNEAIREGLVEVSYPASTTITFREEA